MSADKSVFIEILKKAADKIESAKLLFENERYEDAVSRAYYAVFHAISALLLSKELVYSSHSQVIGAFNREFIKEDIFPPDFAAKVRNLFILRQSGDYSINPSIDRKLAEASIADAGLIVSRARDHLQSAGKF